MLPEDLPAVLAIERAAHVAPWSQGLFEDCFKSHYRLWVWEQHERLVSYLVLLQVVDEWQVMNICVRPDCQGQGLGRQMLQQAINDAVAERANQLLLEVRISNRPAIALYRALGFEEIGRRVGYYRAGDDREDALVMRLPLVSGT